MAGFTVKIDRGAFDRRLKALEAGILSARGLMQIWGEIALRSIARNFASGGRPRWQPLSPLTVARKGHSQPLIGRTGNLARIGYRAADNHVTIGTSPSASAYAAIQQFGGRIILPEITPRNRNALRFIVGGRTMFAKKTRSHEVKIPARPFLMLQDEDIQEMKRTGLIYLKNLK